MVRNAEKKPSLVQLLNAWLERMPFFEEEENWVNYGPGLKDVNDLADAELPTFWKDYRQIYLQSLSQQEQVNKEYFDLMFLDSSKAQDRQLSPRASRAALFIMLYRGYPILQLPFQLLNNLLEIDEQLSTWRYRHMNMVQRMIGTRIGTGGSSGKDYLRGALDKHYIFSDISRLTSFLIERRKLPDLSSEMERRLGFNKGT
jgi:tryptophan 2,3-dioxygenase